MVQSPSNRGFPIPHVGCLSCEPETQLLQCHFVCLDYDLSCSLNFTADFKRQHLPMGDFSKLKTETLPKCMLQKQTVSHWAKNQERTTHVCSAMGVRRAH